MGICQGVDQQFTLEYVHQMRTKITLAITLCAPVFLLALLLPLRDQSWAHFPTGTLTSPLTIGVVLGGLRLIGLGVSFWMTLTTLPYIALRAVGATTLAAQLAKALAPRIRRLVDRVVVTGVLLGATASAPALAAPPPVAVPVEVSIEVSEEPEPTVQNSGTTPTHQVVSGDSFWNIAADLAPDNVVSYWLDLIEINLNVIRSGDPNLIYPGELLILPR